MIDLAFNAIEAVERLEREQMPHGQAVAVAAMMQEGFTTLAREQQKQQEAAKDQTIYVKGIESTTQYGLVEVRSYTNDAVGRLERKIDSGFAAVDKQFTETNSKIDLLRADMDRRFEVFQADADRRFEAFQANLDKRFADADRRFEAFQADMDRRFELVSKDIEIARKGTTIWLGGIMFACASAATGIIIAALRYLG